jgi:hypothetical protein
VEAALDERGVALEEIDRARVEPDAELSFSFFAGTTCFSISDMAVPPG